MTETLPTPVKPVPTPEDRRKTYNVVVISASASTWTALSDCVTFLKQQIGARVTLTHETDDLTSSHYIANFENFYIRFIVLIIDPSKKAVAKTDLDEIISKHSPNGYIFLFEINKDLPKIKQNVQKMALYNLLPDNAVQYTWSVNIVACESAAEPTDIHFRGFCASKNAGNPDNYFYIARETLEAKKCQSAATVPTDVAEIGKLWKPTEDKLLQFVQMLKVKAITRAGSVKMEKPPVVPRRNVRYGMENGADGGLVSDEVPERPVRRTVGNSGGGQPAIDAPNTPEASSNFAESIKPANLESEIQPLLIAPPQETITTQHTIEMIASFTSPCPNLPELEKEQFQLLSTSPIYTILVIGSSEVDKAMLLNNLNCLRTPIFDTLVKEDITCAVPVTITNSEVTVVKSATPNRPDDYIIHFGKFKVWFVNTPTIHDEPYGNDTENNDDIILEYMIKLPELHAIVFTINNDCKHLSVNMKNLMLTIYEILPESALQNCCFMYTSAEGNEFQPGRAASTLLALERKSQKTVLSMKNQFCVDTTALEKVLVYQAGETGGSLEQFRHCWDETAKNLEKFLNYVDGIEPTCPSQWNLDDEGFDPVKSVNFTAPLHDSKNWMLKSLPTSKEQRTQEIDLVFEFEDLSESEDYTQMDQSGETDKPEKLVKIIDSEIFDTLAVLETIKIGNELISEVVNPVEIGTAPMHDSKNSLLNSLPPSEELRELTFDKVSESEDFSEKDTIQLNQAGETGKPDKLAKIIDLELTLALSETAKTANEQIDVSEKATKTTHAPVYERVTDAFNCLQTVLNRQTYIVVVFGALESGKSTLINAISCMQHYQKFEDAAEAVLDTMSSVRFPDANDDFVMIESHDFENPSLMSNILPSAQYDNEFVVDFDNYSVKFVEMPGINVKGGLEHHDVVCHQIKTLLCSLKEVHSFIFTIKEGDDEKSLQNMLQSMFKLLPRNASSNCSFMYTFSNPNSPPTCSKKTLQTFLSRFCSVDGLPFLQLTPNNQFYIDNDPMQFLMAKKLPKGEILAACETCWSLTKCNVEKFVSLLPNAIPIQRNEILHVSKMEQLGDSLLKYSISNAVIRRLMASVAEFGLSGTSIKCKDNCGNAVPLNSDQWLPVAAEFKGQNEKLAKLLEEIDVLFH